MLNSKHGDVFLDDLDSKKRKPIVQDVITRKKETGSYAVKE